MNRDKSLKKFSVRTQKPETVKKKHDPDNPPEYVAIDETEAIALFCKAHDIAPSETHHHRFRVTFLGNVKEPEDPEVVEAPKAEPKKPEPKAKQVADLLPSGKGV